MTQPCCRYSKQRSQVMTCNTQCVYLDIDSDILMKIVREEEAKQQEDEEEEEEEIRRVTRRER